MSSGQDREFSLAGFDADDYWLETELARAAGYYFPDPAEERALAARLDTTADDLLRTAVTCGAAGAVPPAGPGRRLVVLACRGYEAVGVSVIDTSGAVARDAATWLEPNQPAWVGQVLKAESLHNAREAGIDRVAVPEGTHAAALCEALGLHPESAGKSPRR